MTDSLPGPTPKAKSRAVVWFPTTRTGKVAGIMDLAMLAFPLWVLPSWYLVTFLVGAGGMFESPRAVAANSIFQALVVAAALVANLVALFRAKDYSILLGLALIPLSAVLLYMGWFAAERGFPGLAGAY